jgi:hypothetical protein
MMGAGSVRLAVLHKSRSFSAFSFHFAGISQVIRAAQRPRLRTSARILIGSFSSLIAS